MINNTLQIDKYYTVSDHKTDFINIDNKYIKKFEQLISSLEQENDVILCTRGDSKIRNDSFFDAKYMKKFFVVGEKANALKLKQIKDEKYRHIKEENRNIIIRELLDLIKEINKTLRNKSKKHKIKGHIKRRLFKKRIDKIKIEKLLQIKMIFISFLHNNGCKNFKSSSPFLSLSYGKDKFSKAKEFALKRKKKKNGYIFLYLLNKEIFSSSYIITKNFTKLLKRIGIRWYPDIHKEIMLVNGMLPHFILGIYKVENEEIKDFFMNPELYKLLWNKEDNDNFDISEGLSINQKDFMSIASELGHKNIFYSYNNGTYISDVSKDNIQPTIKIKLGN